MSLPPLSIEVSLISLQPPPSSAQVSALSSLVQQVFHRRLYRQGVQTGVVIASTIEELFRGGRVSEDGGGWKNLVAMVRSIRVAEFSSPQWATNSDATKGSRTSVAAASASTSSLAPQSSISNCLPLISFWQVSQINVSIFRFSEDEEDDYGRNNDNDGDDRPQKKEGEKFVGS